MKMRLIIVLMFLMAMTAGVADAEWDWQAAKDQPFQVFDDYVVAVGTLGELEPVEAADIQKAIRDGKEVRLKYAEIQGDLVLYGEVKRDVNFLFTTFSGNVFSSAIFIKRANFWGSKFLEEVSFNLTIFSGWAGFFDARFLDMVSFRRAVFSGGASFATTIFYKRVTFHGAIFSGTPGFERTESTQPDGQVKHEIAIVIGKSSPTPGWVTFKSARFLGEADFSYSVFLGETIFVGCQFRGASDFRGCVYPSDSVLRFGVGPKHSDDFDEGSITEEIRQKFTDNKIMLSPKIDILALRRGSVWRLIDRNFRDTFLIKREGENLNVYRQGMRIYFGGVTNFSQMMIEWEHSDLFGDVPRSGPNGYLAPPKQFGLKGHLEYNESFYISLIKNYRDMGWVEQSDDAYYTFRVAKRSRRANLLYKLAELFFLEITFGYGVKPWILLRSLLLFWVGFSWYYVGFLRDRNDNWVLCWYVAWNPLRHNLRCFTWSLLHSLDIITPGIDLHSLVSLKSGYIFKEKSEGVIWGERIQKLIGWYLLALFLVMFGKIWVR